jgi:hypothetical protein
MESTGRNMTTKEQINTFTASTRDVLDLMDQIADRTNPDCEDCQLRLLTAMEELASTTHGNVLRIADNIVTRRIARRRRAQMN